MEATRDGIVATAPRTHNPRQTAVDILARNLHWRRATTEGQIDPITGFVRTFTTTELARLWGVAPRTVRHGVQAAEAYLRGLRNVVLP